MSEITKEQGDKIIELLERIDSRLYCEGIKKSGEFTDFLKVHHARDNSIAEYLHDLSGRTGLLCQQILKD